MRPSGPSTAEIAAAEARSRAAALEAQRRAAQAAAARRRAANLAARRRAAAARANSPLRILPAGYTEAELAPPPTRGSSEEATTLSGATPVVLAALGALALLLLAGALIPAHAAPWYWAEQTLAGRRQQFAVSGVMCVVAAGVFFALVFLGG